WRPRARPRDGRPYAGRAGLLAQPLSGVSRRATRPAALQLQRPHPLLLAPRKGPGGGGEASRLPEGPRLAADAGLAIPAAGFGRRREPRTRGLFGRSRHPRAGRLCGCLPGGPHALTALLSGGTMAFW